MKIPLSLGRDHAARKALPIMRALGYFTAAIAGLTRHTVRGNAQHNPGETLHWARGKSMDHAECVGRHSFDMMDLHAWLERNPEHPEREAVLSELEHEYDARLWRAAADSQEFYEKYRGSPVSPSSRLPERSEPVKTTGDDPFALLPDEPTPRCRAQHQHGDVMEYCSLPEDHEGDHVGPFGSWPAVAFPQEQAAAMADEIVGQVMCADALHGPAGADWRAPAVDRATWPPIGDSMARAVVWYGVSDTWYFNADYAGSNDRDGFESEAEARAAYWRWKDAQAG